MGTKQAFKTYERGQRIQDTNVTFASGMYFTDAPLVEGFSRLLVNFDFGGEGETLKPRKGFRTVEGEFYNSNLAYQSAGQDSLSDDMSIVAANQVTHSGKNYYQIIVGRIDGVNISHSQTYTGNAWVLTVYKDSLSNTNVIKYTALNDSLISKCIFNKPFGAKASIHDITLKDSAYIKKQIGTFAFNGNYYYFTTDGSLHYTYFDVASEQYKVETVTPYEPTQAETQNSLYNMLLHDKDPYSFQCEQLSGVLRLTGFAPHKIKRDGETAEARTGDLVLHPQNGVEYNYKLYYTYPEEGSYCFHIEYTTGDDSWYPVPRDETVEYTVSDKPFIFENIRVDNPFAQFRIYAIKASNAAFTEEKQFDTLTLANSVLLTASFNYIGAAAKDSTANLELTRYDLSHAKGLTYWKNRLWLFGAAVKSEEGVIQKQDNTILFASDVNRPDWFPYTANADIFDEEIIYLQPMLDELLVFTAHNLYSLALDEDGLGWTRKHLQANLNISSWDLNLIQIVKNMVFFKSGNYYYMVVPKLTAASGSGLAIAPITKNISAFLDNFESNVKQIIDDLFNYSCVTRYKDKSRVTYDLDLVHYYNYLDYEDVHNNYVFEVTKRTKKGFDSLSGIIEDIETVYLTISLLYNTVSRTWRIYTIESERVIQPLVMNATSKGLYTTIVNCGGHVAIQILNYDSNSCIDSYVKQNESTSTPVKIFKNWQYYDSGNLNQNSDMKKRFREYQFKVVNEIKSFIEFYSGFYLDKATRTYEMYYEESYLEDTDSNEAIVVVDATPTAGLQGDPTKRTDTVIDTENQYMYTVLGSWKLGVSKFPNTTNWKIRVPTSGKGYLPRIILISYNQTSYELLSCATVYRQLYSR